MYLKILKPSLVLWVSQQWTRQSWETVPSKEEAVCFKHPVSCFLNYTCVSMLEISLQYPDPSPVSLGGETMECVR